MHTPNSIMEPVKTRGDFRRVLGQEQQGQTSDTEYPVLPPSHPLAELWVTFAEFYGNAWASQYGDRPSWTWLGALDGLSGADYLVGVEACRERDNPFPPNPGEFLAMCRTELPAQARNRIGSERHPESPALPNPNAILTPEQAKPHIQRIRKILEGAEQ